MKKRWMAVPLAVVFLFCSIAPMALADGHYKKGGYDKKGLDDKIYCKAKFMLRNGDELGLSDEQIDRIMDITFATKRGLIDRNAGIWHVKTDIKEKMHEDKTDVPGLQALMDKKYELKKERARFLVQQYAAMKGVMTDEQYTEAKKLWWKEDKKR